MASARLSVMEEDALSFADLLVELRLDRGLSQEALAACAGVSVRAISDLERGATRRPQRETLRALASGLSLGPAERDRFERAANQAPRSAAGRRPAGSSRLPAPVTPLVGRDADLAGVIRLLRTPAIRLVTVCGPGGVGKTRLAAEVGWRMGRSFDQLDGVDLGPLGRADDVPAAVAHGLGCHTAGLPPAEAVAARLGDSRWLLVLDSFERVVPAARWLADLLARCPRLAVLVTSRTPLQLRGEHLWTLAPLPLLSADIADVARLAANPAVALLVERVRAVRPGFALGAHNAVAVAELCRRLDGLPLAIELAAAHLRTQEPAAMLAQWDRRFADLPAVTVDGPERHRTLRCTVEWGTERLAAQDRVLFAVLGAFPGGVTPAAARAVLSADRLAGAGPDPVAFDASVALLAASSLVAVVDRDGGARITMLDTIREVAVDLLAAAGLSDLVNGAGAYRLFRLAQLLCRSRPYAHGGRRRGRRRHRAGVGAERCGPSDQRGRRPRDRDRTRRALHCAVRAAGRWAGTLHRVDGGGQCAQGARPLRGGVPRARGRTAHRRGAGRRTGDRGGTHEPRQSRQRPRPVRRRPRGPAAGHRPPADPGRPAPAGVRAGTARRVRARPGRVRGRHGSGHQRAGDRPAGGVPAGDRPRPGPPGRRRPRRGRRRPRRQPVPGGARLRQRHAGPRPDPRTPRGGASPDRAGRGAAHARAGQRGAAGLPHPDTAGGPPGGRAHGARGRRPTGHVVTTPAFLPAFLPDSRGAVAPPSVLSMRPAAGATSATTKENRTCHADHRACCSPAPSYSLWSPEEPGAGTRLDARPATPPRQRPQPAPTPRRRRRRPPGRSPGSSPQAS